MIISGVGQLLYSDISAIISAHFTTSTVNQLINYVLICNYLSWDSKLPLLYQQLAKRLCTASLEDNNAAIVRKMSRPITVDGHDTNYSRENDLYGQTNAGTALSSNSFKLLWLWRHRTFGPPTECEKVRLQVYWWLLNCDPKLADKVNGINTTFSTVLAEVLATNDKQDLDKTIELLNRLELENIKEILLRCWVPVYFGSNSHYEDRWSRLNDDVVTITPLVRSAEYGVSILTNPALNRSVVVNIFVLANSQEGFSILPEITSRFECTLASFCKRQDALLRLACLGLVLSWYISLTANEDKLITAEADVNDSNPNYGLEPVVVRSSDTKRLLVTNINSHNRTAIKQQYAGFDIDLYMLRFAGDVSNNYQFKCENEVREVLGLNEAEPLSVQYTDTVNNVLEHMLPMLQTLVSVFAVHFPMPAYYHSTAIALQQLMDGDPTIKHGRDMDKVNTDLLKQQLSDRSDIEIKQLCNDYNILIVIYNKEIAVNVLSNYYTDDACDRTTIV